MGVYIKGNPSEGIYRLTYQDTSDKGMVAVLEGEDIAFIGRIVKAPHGRLIDADELIHHHRCESISNDDIRNAPTVIEAEVE